MQAACEAEAVVRTTRRLAWSAYAEGVLDHSQQTGHDSADEILSEIRVSLEGSPQWREDLWSAFVGEMQQSLSFEAIAREWRVSEWCPRLRTLVDSAGCDSLWSWSWTLGATSEEQQLAWEVACSFDGHMTHPCAKTKLGVTSHGLMRLAPEFEPVVPLPVAALSISAAHQCCMPHLVEAGAQPSAAAYFASRFPACYARWDAWLRAAGEEPADFVPLPVHPANLRQLASDLGALLESGLLLLPSADGGALLAQPLMSMRTLLPLRGGGDGGAAMKSGQLAPYVKLPVPIQATSLQR